ncbi:MAG: peroxide stress protein YaaA [Pseudohongiellaceae bacterium]
MIIVISPAKSLDYESRVRTRRHSEPAFLSDSKQLVGQLKKMSPKQLSGLMNISSPLGQLNFERYSAWKAPFNPGNARQAVFAFKGDVYLGLKVEEFSAADLGFAQNHLRILSGLYGVLRPLDLMQPYRLEMGTRLQNKRGQNLYEFWDAKPTRFLNEEFAAMREQKTLINLASNEYFGVLQPKALEADVVSPVFKDFVNGKYRVVSFFAKKARGSMAAWIIRKRLKNTERLHEFNVDGYRYSKAESSAAKPVFLRKKAA